MLILVVWAMLSSAAPAQESLDFVPNYNIDFGCQRVAQTPQDFRDCMKEEVAGQQTVIETWFRAPLSKRKECRRMIDRVQSYRILAVCLQDSK